MPVLKDDAVLFLPNTKNTIALYSKASHTITDSLSLFSPGGSGSKDLFCPVTIWMDTSAKINLSHLTGQLPQYKIESGKNPIIWLDNSLVIIGTGDLRDGTAESGSVDLADISQGDLIIKYYDDYLIEIYSVNPITLSPINAFTKKCL